MQCIVPPYVLESIARHGNRQQRTRARASLASIATVHASRVPRSSRPARSFVEAAPMVPTKHREIYTSKHTDDLPGTLLRSEGDGPVTDVDVNRVFDGFGATWDLYFEVYGRNSYDGHGAPLIGSVHYLNGYDNAFWSDDDGQMAFGDGDGQLFNSFTVSVDVMGHELTHAVTSRTSGLVYQDQSGALNEHVSDVFGSLVKQRGQQPPQTADQADWLIGQGLLAAGVNGVALRSMKAPGTAFDDPVLGKDPQPDTMADYVHTTDDNGGVHTNSGIPNKAFYLFAAALGGFAWERAGMVWFATCTDGTLPSDASFQTFADHTTDHAYELFGHDVAQACATAWAGVGITVTTVRHVDHTQGRTQAPPIAGNPSGYTFVAPGSGEEDPCVVYRGVDSHVYGAWRSPSALGRDDLTTLAGAPLALSDPVGYVFDQVGMQNASYVGVDSHLHGLYWNVGAVGHDDLSNLSGVFPTGTPAAYISPPYGMQNLVVRAAGGLKTLWWNTGPVGVDDTTGLAGAPSPAEDVAAYFSSNDATANVVYRTTDGHLHQLWWAQGPVGHGDLTEVAGGAPLAAGKPAAYFQDTDATHHVIYRGQDGHLYEMWWQGPSAPGVGDLTDAAGGAPLASDDPYAYFQSHDGTHHVIYRSSDGHLHELWWTTGVVGVGHGDLMVVSDAPAAASGTPNGYLTAGGTEQHVFYRGADSHLHELAWR